jgi:hypothetical protein
VVEMKVRLSVLMAALAVGAVLPASASAGTLDQQQTQQNTSVGVNSTQSLAQTFTAGLSGVLDRVDLLLAGTGVGLPTAPMTVEIRDAPGGNPGTTVLASASVPSSAVALDSYAFVPATLAIPVNVSAGTQYAIVAYSSTDGTHTFIWGLESVGDPYPPGAPFFQAVSPPGPTWAPDALGGDQAFKTYVTPPAPPSGQGNPTSPINPAGHLRKRKCKKAKRHHASAAKKRKCHKKRK